MVCMYQSSQRLASASMVPPITQTVAKSQNENLCNIDRVLQSAIAGTCKNSPVAFTAGLMAVRVSGSPSLLFVCWRPTALARVAQMAHTQNRLCTTDLFVSRTCLGRSDGSRRSEQEAYVRCRLRLGRR